mgnify:CR=1 FL=1
MNMAKWLRIRSIDDFMNIDAANEIVCPSELVEELLTLTIQIITNLQKEYNIKSIAFNKDYTPFAIKRDNTIIDWCKQNDIACITEEDYTLYNMNTILNNSKKPYQVFTPFYKASLKHSVKSVVYSARPSHCPNQPCPSLNSSAAPAAASSKSS